MSKIPAEVTTLTTSYAMALWCATGGGFKQCSLSTLLTYLNANMTVGKAEYTKQYSSPVAAATVEVTAGDDNYWVIITPTGTLATLTIELPAVANLTDGQEVLVTSTQELTALTVDKNDATNIYGEPTTLSAEGYFKMKYVSFTDSWYRVG